MTPTETRLREALERALHSLCIVRAAMREEGLTATAELLTPTITQITYELKR